MVLEGIKLCMEIVDARLMNYGGFALLIMSKNISVLEGLLHKPFRREILEILDKELKEARH